MKTEKKKIFIIILAASLAIAVFGAALLTFAMKYSYNSEIDHFEYGDARVTASAVICIIGALISVLSFIAAGKKTDFSHKSPKKFFFAECFSSALAAWFCIFYGITAFKNPVSQSRKFFFILTIVFAFLSALYFLLCALGFTRAKPSVGFTSAFVSLECAFMLLLVYFTYEKNAMNSPVKIYELIMLVSFMLFFAAEAGCCVGRPGTERKYAFASCFAISSGGMICISRLVCTVIGNNGFDFSLLENVFHFVLWLHILMSFTGRVIEIKTISSSESSEEVEAVSEIENTQDGNDVLNGKEVSGTDDN